MAQRRPAVPSAVKRELLKQTNGKCANPGCSNTLLEIHHIHEWHVYKSHDEPHMIAICASCHDNVSRGSLQISDEDVYRWKKIKRSDLKVAHAFVEPGGQAPLLILGSIGFQMQGSDNLTVLDLAGGPSISFSVRDGEIMLLNLRLTSASGELLVDVVDGYVRTRRADVKLESRPGRIFIPGGLDVAFTPAWARKVLEARGRIQAGEEIPLLDIEVLEPGVVRMSGVWSDKDATTVAYGRHLSFAAPDGRVYGFAGPEFGYATFLFEVPEDMPPFSLFAFV